MRKKDEQGEVSAEGVGAVGKVADLEDRIDDLQDRVDELERVKAQLKNYDVELARVSAEMEKRVSQLEVEGENQRTIQALGLRLLYQPVEFRREATTPEPCPDNWLDCPHARGFPRLCAITRKWCEWGRRGRGQVDPKCSRDWKRCPDKSGDTMRPRCGLGGTDLECCWRGRDGGTILPEMETPPKPDPCPKDWAKCEHGVNVPSFGALPSERWCFPHSRPCPWPKKAEEQADTAAVCVVGQSGDGLKCPCGADLRVPPAMNPSLVLAFSCGRCDREYIAIPNRWFRGEVVFHTSK